MHAARWILYFIRFILYLLTGLLRFISKPGSRLIVPIALVVGTFLARPYFHTLLDAEVQLFDPQYRPESFILEALLAVALLAIIPLYVLLSRGINAVLGAFPVTMRPLPPMRKLKPTKTEITSAKVRIVVPRLPKR